MTDAASNQKPSAIAKRNAARLMAVQAVYQMAVNNKAAALVVAEYLSHRSGEVIDGESTVEPNESLFADIVLGVAGRREDLAGIVSANRPMREGQSTAEEPLLDAIFLCGVFELMAHQDIDSPVIISSYVDVAKAFFPGNEPKLVNGVLDSARKVLRA